MMVSLQGRNWMPIGPRLDGREVSLALDTGSELWFAGESYTEGPTHSPFLLRYSAGRAEVAELEIYDGPSELVAIALEAKTGRMRAWVRHIDMAQQNWGKGPIYLQESSDAGQAWAVVGKVSRVPGASPGLRFFRELPQRSGEWRVSKRDSLLERRQPNGNWQHVAAPAFMPCSD